MVNSLQNNKILDWSKFKVLVHANDKIHMTQDLNFISGRLENILGKGENAGNQHFLLFPKGFQRASFRSVVKSPDKCVVNGEVDLMTSTSLVLVTQTLESYSFPVLRAVISNRKQYYDVLEGPNPVVDTVLVTRFMYICMAN